MARQSLLEPHNKRLTQFARWGVVHLGRPVVVTGSNPVVLATPTQGGRLRFKWISVARAYHAADSDNEFTIRWSGGGDLYGWAIGRQPLFTHAVVREGAAGQALEIVQTIGTERLIVNIDWEEIDLAGYPVLTVGPTLGLRTEIGDNLLTELGDWLVLDYGALDTEGGDDLLTESGDRFALD